MAVTQYIGARYVPLFADPIEWSSTYAYEPLTIVLYQGASYTSKRSVPKGIDISNEDYWVCTGNYDEQVEAYRKETKQVATDLATANENIDSLTKELDATNKTVKANTSQILVIGTNTIPAIENDIDALQESEQEFDTRIKNLEEKKVGYTHLVCIGDSWAEGYNVSTTYANPWPKVLATKLGIEDTSETSTTFYNSYKGGAGFYAASDGVNFSSLITTAATKISADDVDLVVIGGGINDRGYWSDTDISSVKNSTQLTIANAISTFPNAQIWVFPMLLAGGLINSGSMAVMKAIVQSVTEAGNSQVHVYGDCYDWIYDNPTYHGENTMHCSEAGAAQVAYYMADVINGGNPTQHITNVAPDATGSYALNEGAYIRRNGNILTGYMSCTSNVPNGSAFCSIPNRYSPGSWFGCALSDSGGSSSVASGVIGINTQGIDDTDSWGFAPAYLDTLSMNYAHPYISATWTIQDWTTR